MSQVQAGGIATFVPLPGLVLLDWLILGLAGIFVAFRSVRSEGAKGA